MCHNFGQYPSILVDEQPQSEWPVWDLPNQKHACKSQDRDIPTLRVPTKNGILVEHVWFMQIRENGVFDMLQKYNVKETHANFNLGV